MYDIQKIREDFPILDREVYGKPLIYLDNGATTQKPRQVVEAITDEYYSVNAIYNLQYVHLSMLKYPYKDHNNFLSYLTLSQLNHYFYFSKLHMG